MHRFFASLILVFLLPHGTTFADTTSEDQCNRLCGSATVPYPFGFSAGCPIALSCEANTSTPILPSRGAYNSSSYRVLVFNSTASIITLALPPSCSRSIPDARRTLSGTNYGVSSRTGLFLRGGCSETISSSCSVPVTVMSRLLQTAQCGDNDTVSAADAMACVASTSPNATNAGVFLQWAKADLTNCSNVLTSALFADTPEGTVSLEYGLAELGWWLNGTCAAAGEPCAANATCSDVTTPRGAGHRCACVWGMDGDGFSAGDGCYLKAGFSPQEIQCCVCGGTSSGCTHKSFFYGQSCAA